MHLGSLHSRWLGVRPMEDAKIDDPSVYDTHSVHNEISFGSFSDLSAVSVSEFKLLTTWWAGNGPLTSVSLGRAPCYSRWRLV